MVFDQCSSFFFLRKAVRFGLLCSSIQALTLDGVVEIKNQHFWSIAFGSYVSTYPIHVVQIGSVAAVQPCSLPVTTYSLPAGGFPPCSGEEGCLGTGKHQDPLPSSTHKNIAKTISYVGNAAQ